MDPSPVGATLARNVRTLREAKSWSLATLAERSGVSKGMLVQIENVKVNPSLSTIVRIAGALGTNVGRLVEAEQPTRVWIRRSDEHLTLWRSARGGSAVLVGDSDRQAQVETWRWTMVRGDEYQSKAHPPATVEHLLVIAGTLRLDVAGTSHEIHAGESAVFEADRDHGYAHSGKKSSSVEFVMCVITPESPVPRASESRRKKRTL
jgi:transcriptional regulator with XRE-family HTH domain